MKKNIKIWALTFLGFLFSVSSVKAQNAYWTENFESEMIPGNSGSAIKSSTAVNLSATSGTWDMYYVFRGAAGCNGKPLRLMKKSAPGIDGIAFAITPVLKKGIGNITFIETSGGNSKVIGVYKSSDKGKTWDLVKNVSVEASPCQTYQVEVNDPSANKIKFTNESNSDVNLDVVTVFQSGVK